MSYIKLDKSQLVDLEYTLTKELLRSSRSGTYSCTTLNFCNTRKYHGLLVVPQPGIDDERHVLLSSMDETVIQHNTEFNLGVHKYPGTYSPKGHKYIIDFETDPIPRHIYKVGGVHLKKEIIFTSNDDRILIKYTLISANSPTIIRVRPYLAFRNIHALSKANMYADTKYETIDNGIKVCMYEGYTPLHFQISKPCDYIHSPDWYHDIEYQKELERGYEGHEDLYVPGYFEIPISKNEEIIISVGTESAPPQKLKQLFSREVKKRTPRNTFENCLENSTQQFFVSDENNRRYVVAGFPWHNSRLRDTFISLPGLTLIHKDYKTFSQVMQTATENMAGPHFSISGRHGIHTDYSADTSLWFIRALQLAVEMQAETSIGIWKNYNKFIRAILYGYRNNESPTVYMREDGLLSTRPHEAPLTWMDAINDGKPVTPRTGMTVEANALWYNAIIFAVTIAKEAKDNVFVKDFRDLHCLIPVSFKKVFWDKARGYLADNAGEFHTDWSVRPNILFAASLPFSPISEKIRQLVVELVRSKLLTPRGLRTLSPDDPSYQSFYYGNETRRAMAYHQGTVWPWLLGAYTEAYLNIYGKSGLYHVEQIYESFKDTVLEHAIGSISEVYDGDPPHRGAGAISMAWSVAEIRRMKYIIDQHKEEIV